METSNHREEAKFSSKTRIHHRDMRFKLFVELNALGANEERTF